MKSAHTPKSASAVEPRRHSTAAAPALLWWVLAWLILSVVLHVLLPAGVA